MIARFLPVGLVLIVLLTATGWLQGAERIKHRPAEDLQVRVEMRLLDLPTPGIGGEFGLGLGRNATAFLNDAQVAELIKTAQADVRTSVRQFPRWSVTNGEAVSLPLSEPLEGLAVSCGTTVSADRRLVLVKATIEQKDPRTGKLECVQRAVFMPDGHTAVVGCGTKQLTFCTATKIPVLGDIPFIGRLFTNVGHGRETRHRLLLVTPHIVAPREEEVRQVKNEYCTPIIHPTHKGKRAHGCVEPPDEAEVLRALSAVPSIPHLCERSRDNVQIVTERLTDRTDAPRFFPLVGPARLHHCHWKCTVYYDETVEVCYPTPFRCTRPRVEVVYLDRDCLQLCTKKESARLMRTKTSAKGGEECSEPAEDVQARKVARLLKKYEQACAVGDLDSARKIARRALNIDPRCFSKP
jgi:hypothetical protein